MKQMESIDPGTSGLPAAGADGGSARPTRKVIYKDIPPELRRAACESVRLRRAGLPVPDDVRRNHNLYKQWVNHDGKDPAEAPNHKTVHTYIPEHLRKANTTYCRKRREGQVPTKEEAADAAEYRRWIQYGAKPPEKEEPLPPPKAEWPLSAALEWDRLISEGTSPGDIPEKIAQGRAEHLGIAPKKFTKCSQSDVVGGRGCRGRHGNGSRRPKYGPGVAVCSNCDTSYKDVPADVNWCGCCGSNLRKSARFKK